MACGVQVGQGVGVSVGVAVQVAVTVRVNWAVGVADLVGNAVGVGVGATWQAMIVRVMIVSATANCRVVNCYAPSFDAKILVAIINKVPIIACAYRRLGEWNLVHDCRIPDCPRPTHFVP